MSADEIANHVAVMIEAMRVGHLEKYVHANAFVATLMLDPAVVAAAVTAYLASVQRGR